jgi:hypothetical protein
MKKRKNTRSYGKSYGYQEGGRVRISPESRMFESLRDTPNAPAVSGEVDIGGGVTLGGTYRKGDRHPGNDPRPGWGIGARWTIPFRGGD